MLARWDLIFEQAVPRNGDLVFAMTFPWSVVGHDFEWTLWRNSRGDGTALITCDTGDNGGVSAPVGTDGKVYFAIPQARLAEHPAGTYYYFIRDIQPSGKVVTVHGELQTFGPAS